MERSKNRVFVYMAVCLFLLNTALISAAEINYTIDVNLADSNNTAYMISKSYAGQCETSCNSSIPSFDVPPGYTITGYSLEYDQQKDYKIYFQSTNDKSTLDANDLIMMEVFGMQTPQNKTPEITCNEDKCDDECVVCKDNKCHPPEFKCIEKIEIERISPSSASIGITQMNLLIRNTGTVDLGEIYAELSGDGIATTKRMPIASLVAGDKDYTFTEINATKPGNIDLVIKLYLGGVLVEKALGQLAVLAKENEGQEANVTGLTALLDQLKEKYMALEQDYQDKNANGYQLGTIYDQLKETRGYLANAQSYILEADYRKAEANLQISLDDLNSIEMQLKNAKKKKVTFMDKVRSNLLYIGSAAAAIVSIFAAYSAIKNSIRRQQLIKKEHILKLRERLKRDKGTDKKDKKGKKTRKAAEPKKSKPGKKGRKK